MGDVTEREEKLIEAYANVLSRLEQVERKGELNVEEIAEIAAVKAESRVFDRIYKEIGLSVVAKTPRAILYLIGAGMSALLASVVTWWHTSNK